MLFSKKYDIFYEHTEIFEHHAHKTWSWTCDLVVLKLYKTQRSQKIMKLIDMSFLGFFCWELVRRALDKETDKGRTGCFFAECQYSRHSTKREPLLSVTVALGKVSVAVTWHRDLAECHGGTRQSLCRRHLAPWRRLFIAEYQVALDKVFVECPTKSNRYISRHCRCIVYRDFFAECNTWQRFHRAFFTGTRQSRCFR
jgi:hypothetical protein